MKIMQNHRSFIITVFLFAAILLLVPATASAQDDKGPVNSFNANMATQAQLLGLSSIWNVTECCGWVDTWWRRPNTNVFDAKARHTNGTIVTFSVELISWNKTTNQVLFYRAGIKGSYKGVLANGGASIVNGTTTWYPPNTGWSAAAVVLDPNQDEKGRVNIPR
ncbi:MAG TPA: hypothetical protein VF451_03245 [Acidobacteriota bacterium]